MFPHLLHVSGTSIDQFYISRWVGQARVAGW